MFNIKTYGRFHNIYITDDAAFTSDDVVFNPRVGSVSVPDFKMFNISDISKAGHNDYVYIENNFGADWKSYLVDTFTSFLSKKIYVICENPPCKYFHNWHFISDGHYICTSP